MSKVDIEENVMSWAASTDRWNELWRGMRRCDKSQELKKNDSIKINVLGLLLDSSLQ